MLRKTWWHHGYHVYRNQHKHYDDVIMGAMVSQITRFKRRSKKTSKLRVTSLCAGNSPGTGEFPAEMASNAENVSIWWHHHVHCTSELSLSQTRISLNPCILAYTISHCTQYLFATIYFIKLYKVYHDANIFLVMLLQLWNDECFCSIPKSNLTKMPT